MPVYTDKRNKLDNLKMLTAFSFPGQTIKTNVPYFGIEFEQRNQKWRYLRSHELIMIIDGDRVEFGAGKHSGNITSTGVLENILFIVNRDTFEVLSNAKTVEMQLGPYEGFLDAENIAKLKAYFALTTPQLQPK